MMTSAARVLAGSALVMLMVSPALAEEGHDAPTNWPPPMEEHLFWAAGFDRLEYAWPDKGEGESFVWDFEAWYGGDFNRIYLKTEGENTQGDGAGAEFEYLDLLYSRLVSDFWELQGGIGYQGGLGNYDHPERFHAVMALQGLAPFYIETDLALRISEEGDAWVQLEVEHDVRLTQRLYLQPRAELVAAGTEVEEFHMGEGVNSLNTGLRLRYEVTRKLAPYVGVYWEKRYGDTADMARAHGDPTETAGLMAGVRWQF